MTDSVWWYVLAGLLFGFILSTLWEWLYFRQRRIRIENRRIAELEATVRTLSAAPRSVENTTSPGLAAGYQSPLVFLEGEVEDVDTVEVIVPATPEPVKFDQSTATQPAAALQPPAETQAVTSKWSTSASVHNGYGVVHEAPDSEPGTSIAVGGETSHRSVSPAVLAAAAVAATTAIANDKDQTPAAQPPPAPPMSAALVSEPQVQANQAQVPQAAAPQATQAPGVQVESEPQEPEPSSDSSGKKPVRVAVLASATEQTEAPDLSGAPQPATIPDTPPPVAQVSASEPSASATTPTDASSPADQEGDTASGTPDAVQHPAAKAAEARP